MLNKRKLMTLLILLILTLSLCFANSKCFDTLKEIYPVADETIINDPGTVVYENGSDYVIVLSDGELMIYKLP